MAPRTGRARSTEPKGEALTESDRELATERTLFYFATAEQGAITPLTASVQHRHDPQRALIRSVSDQVITNVKEARGSRGQVGATMSRLGELR